MPNFTPNYNLEKPLANESYSIDVFNANSDKVDTAIKVVSDSLDDNINDFKYTTFNGDIKAVEKTCNLYCTGSTLNLPFTSSFYIDVTVNEGAPENYRKLRARRFSTNQIFETTMNNGIWSNWEIVSRGSSSMNHYVTTTGTNNLTATSQSVILEAGLELTIKNTTANTGNVTLNFNTGGAKPVLRNGGTQLTAGSLIAGGIYKLVYDGVNFILLEEGGVRIKSVQRGTVNFNANSTYQAITISTVDMSKALVKISFSGGGSTPATSLVGAVLSGSTVLGLYKGNNDTTALQVNWEVIEYSGNVNVQRGISELTNGNDTMSVTISSVNTANSFVECSNRSGSTTTRNQQQVTVGNLTSSTNLSLYRASSDNYSMVYWQVIEFK